MKVLLATPYFSPRVGGLETYALNLALELKALGWEVVVVAGDTAVTTQTQSEVHGMMVYRLPITTTISNTPFNPAWPKLLRRIIKQERPDVINTHTPVPFMVDSVLLAAGKTPVIITYHAATLFKPSSLVMKLITITYLSWEKLLFRRARKIVAVSPYVATALASRFHRHIDVVSNAVGLPTAPTTASRAGLVFIANLEPTHAWKGLGLILTALSVSARHLQDVPHLTIIGDGASRQSYEAQVKSLGIERFVTFTGRLDPAARDRVMTRAAALIAYPTTANDAFPTVFLEAWSLGLPVIAASIGPIPSLIEAGVTGILVPPGDPAKLSEAITQAFADTPKLKLMGAQGRRLIKSQLNWPVQARIMSNLLKEVL